MLDEFILKHLEEIKIQQVELQDRFDELNLQETAAQEQIENLLKMEDVGLELFSPRNTGEPVKDKIQRIQNSLEETQLAIADVSERIAENLEKKKKYESLLRESHDIDDERDYVLKNNRINRAEQSTDGIQKNISGKTVPDEALDEEINNHPDHEKQCMDKKSEASSAEDVIHPYTQTQKTAETGKLKETEKSKETDDDKQTTDTVQLQNKAINEAYDDSIVVLDRSNLIEVLKRVEKSMNYAYSDKNKCKNELRNLQYYLKALLSKK